MKKERWHPGVPLARRIGQELGADVIVIARSENGQWCGASWGRTKARCESLGRVLDELFDTGPMLGTITMVDTMATIWCDRGCPGAIRVPASDCDVTITGYTNFSCTQCGAQMVVDWARQKGK